MKEYFVIWTYIANYGVMKNYSASSPEDCARRVAIGFSEDFQKKGKVYVFDSPPAAMYDQTEKERQCTTST